MILNDIEYNKTSKNTIKKQFNIKKVNYKKIEKLAKKHYKSKSYILDIILDNVKA